MYAHRSLLAKVKYNTNFQLYSQVLEPEQQYPKKAYSAKPVLKTEQDKLMIAKDLQKALLK